MSTRKLSAWTWFAAAFAILVLTSSPWVRGQGQSAGIVGVVTDTNGNVVPDAKVTITSPALQVQQKTTASDAQGNYKFVDLPAPGVYHISFEAKGFQTLVRDGINLGVGFTAKIDAPLAVGAVTQVVEVQAAGPVVDTVSSAGTATLQQVEIQDTPKGLGMQELLPLAAGVSLQGAPDVGDSNLANRLPVVTYGVVMTPYLLVEGVNTNTAKDSDSSVYLDSLAMAEVEFKTSGNNADVPFPGVEQVAVMKSGGNTFHGDAEGDYENPDFQGNNITPALAAPPNNLKFGNPLEGSGYYDYAGDIGGRIITDKLWFYGGYSKQSVNQGSPSFVGAPNAPLPTTVGGTTCWLASVCSGTKSASITTSLSEYNYKVSYQVKPSTKLLFSELHGSKFLEANSASPLIPLPAAQYELQPGPTWHAEVQSIIGTKFLIDGSFGYGGYHVNYTSMPASEIGQFGFTKGSDFAGSPSQEELSTKAYTGPYPEAQNKPQNRYEMKIAASYNPARRFLGGSHQLTAGTLEDWEYAGTAVLKDKPSGDYLLEFQNNLPNRIVVYNYPFPTSINSVFSQAGYGTDTWSLRHVVLNLGVRFDRFNAFYPTQSKPAGQFSSLFPAETFPSQQIVTWTDVVPRVGGAWDVRGNGKTVIKGSFGIFGDTMGDTFAATFNPNAQQSLTYSWTGLGNCQAVEPLAPVAVNCDVTPAFLATLPTLKPITATGGASQVLNPNLKQDRTHEYTVKFERQLVPNVAISGGYVRHSLFNMYDSATNAGPQNPTATFVNNGVDVGHTYNIPVLFTDSFKGQSTPVTIYTYAAGSGTIANEVVNTPSNRPDVYNSFEAAITKRYSKRWNGFASYWMTKDHRWLQGTEGILGSPNDDAYPIDNTWNWELRGDGVYHLPKGFEVSSMYRAQSGTAGQRVSVFNTGGVNPTTLQPVTLAQGSTNVRMGPFGQYRGPMISVWNMRAAKVFSFESRFHLEANFQVYNILNKSAAVKTNYQTGASTFGVISTILSPRVARIGALLTF